MLGFLLGLTAGMTALSTRPQMRNGLSALLAAGEDAAVCAVHTARRVSAQIREDLEDIMAEAQSTEER